jgi:hypothetical protein
MVPGVLTAVHTPRLPSWSASTSTLGRKRRWRVLPSSPPKMVAEGEAVESTSTDVTP